jgi:hypothetical protein
LGGHVSHLQSSFRRACFQCRPPRSPELIASTRAQELIAAAGGGDHDAFGALVVPYRRELHAHYERIKEITAFVTRITQAPDRAFFARWPEQAVDPSRLAAFESFGLPGRLD